MCAHYLSVTVSLCVSVYVCLCGCMSVCVCVCVSVSLFVCVSEFSKIERFVRIFQSGKFVHENLGWSSEDVPNGVSPAYFDELSDMGTTIRIRIGYNQTEICVKQNL